MSQNEPPTLNLVVTPNIKLRESQIHLYRFVLGKYESKGVINLSEIVEQYSTYGCREFVGGKPAGYTWAYNRETDSSHSHLVALTEEELKRYAIQWFVRNLGVFLVKGLLTAVPAMKLSDIENKLNTGDK